MTNQHILLKTENLSIGYQNKKNSQILAQNINLQLEKNQLLALVGPNGVGKSTLLKTLINEINPISGSVFLQNTPINLLDNQQKALAISLVLTEKIPFSNLNVQQIVALGRHPHTNWLGKLSDSDHQIVQNALELTDLTNLANKPFAHLSDGQQQRALIARAIAQDTPIIILDEPTTHLDIPHKVGILKLLKNIAHTQNKTILFSTHDLDMAIALSDQMIILNKQNCIQNSPENLIKLNAFQQIFNSKDIFFDPLTKSFKINFL